MFLVFDSVQMQQSQLWFPAGETGNGNWRKGKEVGIE